MHVRPLSVMIKSKFKALSEKDGMMRLIPQSVWTKNWVCHIEPVGSGEAALKYLAPYIFRVALSDRNILSLKDGSVVFRVKNRETGLYETHKLPALEFIRRFFQHVLPRGFVKVRYYGFLSTKNRAVLEVVKKQLGLLLSPIKRTIQKVSKPFMCATCGKPMAFIAELPRKRGPPLESFLHVLCF